MHLQELKSLESRVLEPLPIPVIGRCLQKKAVTALCEDPTFRTSKYSIKRLRIFLELAIAVPGFGDRILPY